MTCPFHFKPLQSCTQNPSTLTSALAFHTENLPKVKYGIKVWVKKCDLKFLKFIYDLFVLNCWRNKLFFYYSFLILFGCQKSFNLLNKFNRLKETKNTSHLEYDVNSLNQKASPYLSKIDWTCSKYFWHLKEFYSVIEVVRVWCYKAKLDRETF